MILSSIFSPLAGRLMDFNLNFSMYPEIGYLILCPPFLFSKMTEVQEGKLKRLSAVVNNNGVDEEVDTTLIYYPLRDIEGIRKGLEQLGHEVVISVCFDMPSKRKESDNDYKSGRVHRLGDSDHHNLDPLYCLNLITPTLSPILISKSLSFV